MGYRKHGTLFHPEMQKLPSCIFLIFFVIINLTRKTIQIKQSRTHFCVWKCWLTAQNQRPCWFEQRLLNWTSLKINFISGISVQIYAMFFYQCRVKIDHKVELSSYKVRQIWTRLLLTWCTGFYVWWRLNCILMIKWK